MPRSIASTTTLADADSSAAVEESKDRQAFSSAIAALTASSEEAQNRRALTEFVSLPAEEFDRRLEQARAGDLQSLDWLRRAFETDPTGQLEVMYGSSAVKQLESTLVFRATGDDPVARTSLLTQVERMRRELAGPEPSALERVLADRVALSHLALHTLELQYEREKHDLGPALAEAMERRIARTNRQFNEACKMLATVRRLAVPMLQVMIAEQQQVNFRDQPSRTGTPTPGLATRRQLEGNGDAGP